jgi:hypothetical protein
MDFCYIYELILRSGFAAAVGSADWRTGGGREGENRAAAAVGDALGDALAGALASTRQHSTHGTPYPLAAAAVGDALAGAGLCVCLSGASASAGFLFLSCNTGCCATGPDATRVAPAGLVDAGRRRQGQGA